MEYQSTYNMIGGALLAALGWFASQLWDAVKELKTDLAILRETLPKQYIAKEDFKESVSELKALLLAISNKLDTKADK